MARRRIIPACALALGLVFAFLCASGQPALGGGAADLCADTYPSIQDAIYSAGVGATVGVPVGHYSETLIITRSITLQGGWNSACSSRVTTDPAQTVIDGAQGGSVIQITGSAPTLEGLTITGGLNNLGGGVHIKGASPALTHLIVTGNAITTTAAEKAYGAGLYIKSSTVTINHTDIVSNVSYAYLEDDAAGRGVCVAGFSETVVLSATRIMSNVAARGTDLYGGGMMVGPGAQVVFQGTQNLIAFNDARLGGGIYLYEGSVSGAAILSNTASGSGGGVVVFGGGGAVLANSIIAGNGGGPGGRNGVYVAGGGTEIANNTIVGNGGNTGSGVEFGHLGTEVLTLTNNIIGGHDIGIYNHHETISPTLVTNDLWDNRVNYYGVMTGTADVHVDPMFLDPAGGDYCLSLSSALIDAGTTSDWLTTGFEGDPRPVGTEYDIGADEGGARAYLPLTLRTHAP